MTSGIYQIRNTLTGECYIGATIHLESRQSAHFSQLKSGTHHCKPLQASFDRHGEGAFVVDVLESCGGDMLSGREACWVSKLKPAFNTGKTGMGLTGEDYAARHVINLTDAVEAAVEKFRIQLGVARQTDAIRILINDSLRTKGLL